MHIEEFREYCLSKKGVTEETPFGPDTLVYKVMGKLFALTGLDREDFRINLKNDPDTNIELRERYKSIIPGYHMNKQHWNTVIVSGGMSEQFLKKLIDESYAIVVKGLPKKVQKTLWEE